MPRTKTPPTHSTQSPSVASKNAARRRKKPGTPLDATERRCRRVTRRPDGTLIGHHVPVAYLTSEHLKSSRETGVPPDITTIEFAEYVAEARVIIERDNIKPTPSWKDVLFPGFWLKRTVKKMVDHDGKPILANEEQHRRLNRAVAEIERLGQVSPECCWKTAADMARIVRAAAADPDVSDPLGTIAL